MVRGYKLKITLNGSRPPIWRTCVLPEGLALRELPDVFARIMGWRNSEHDPVRAARFYFPDSNETFETDGKSADGQSVRWVEEDANKKGIVGVTAKVLERRDLSPDEPLADPLFAAAAAGGKVFTYTMLPGKVEWEHRVQVQKVAEKAKSYPEIIAHSGECPPATYEGGIFSYQSLSPKERRKARDGFIPYRPDMIQQRLKDYYNVKATGDDKPEKIYKIKINEDEMIDKFMEWMKERDADVPEHYSYRDALGDFEDESLERLLAIWKFTAEDYRDLDTAARVDLLAKKYEEPGMIERYLRCVSDAEWQSIKNAVEWKESWRYYIDPEEDDFHRMLTEGFVFITEFEEIEITDELREIFPRLDQDPFFRKRRQEISWIRDCAETAVSLYTFVPISLIARLCVLKKGCDYTEAQIRGALAELAPNQQVYHYVEKYDEIWDLELDLESGENMRQYVRQDLDYWLPRVDVIGVGHGQARFLDRRDLAEKLEKQLSAKMEKDDVAATMITIYKVLAIRSPEREAAPETQRAFLLMAIPQLLTLFSPAEAKNILKTIDELSCYIHCADLKGWTLDQVKRGLAKKK